MALLGGTDAFCHILQLFFQAHMRGMHLYRSSKYTISNSNSFLQLLQLFHVKYRRADQAFLEWWYLCMKSLLWTCWGRVNLKLVFFSFYCNNKKRIYSAMQHIHFSYELFLSDCCFLFMKVQCCIAREKFFHFPLSSRMKRLISNVDSFALPLNFCRKDGFYVPAKAKRWSLFKIVSRKTRVICIDQKTGEN